MSVDVQHMISPFCDLYIATPLDGAHIESIVGSVAVRNLVTQLRCTSGRDSYAALRASLCWEIMAWICLRLESHRDCDSLALLDGLWRRETYSRTFPQEGWAFPHMKQARVDNTVVVLVPFASGVGLDFESDDGLVTQLLHCGFIPPGRETDWIHVITRSFNLAVDMALPIDISAWQKKYCAAKPRPLVWPVDDAFNSHVSGC